MVGDDIRGYYFTGTRQNTLFENLTANSFYFRRKKGHKANIQMKSEAIKLDEFV